MDQDQALYLRLSEDFGGARFGPFEGVEVGLGSDDSNDICIPESFGVAPEHAKVVIQEGRGILITPVAQTTPIYVWKGRASKPNQISTPTAVRHGDSFALVSAHGPRFFVEIDSLPEEVLAQRRNFRGKENLTKDAMKKEARRRMFLRVMTTGWGQRIGKAWWFVRSGQIFLPRNIFKIVGIGGGWVMGTLAMCSKADSEAELVADQEKLDAEKERTGNMDYITLGQQLSRVTGLRSFEYLLPLEEELAGKIREKAKRLYARKNAHAWLTNPAKAGSGRLTKFMSNHEQIQEWTKIDEDTRRLLPWAGASGRAFRDNDDNSWWALEKDSEGNKVCHRGPLSMTWTQAAQLGMDTKLDFFALDLPQEGDETTKALQTSARRVQSFDRESITESLSLVTRHPEGTDDSYCRVVEGNDARDSLSGLESALRSGRGGLPEFDPDSHHLSTATLMKFFSADTKGADFSGGAAVIDFRDSLAGGLATAESDAIPWVIDRTAETIAAAAVLPCVRRTEFRDNELPDSLAGENGGYQPIDCILLRYVVEYGDVARE